MADAFAHHFPIDRFTLEVSYDPGPYSEQFELGCTATINGDRDFRIPGVVNISPQTPVPVQNDINYGLDDKQNEVATVSLRVSDRDFEMFRAIAIQRSENRERPTHLDFVVKTGAAFVRGTLARQPLTHSAFFVGYSLHGAP